MLKKLLLFSCLAIVTIQNPLFGMGTLIDSDAPKGNQPALTKPLTPTNRNDATLNNKVMKILKMDRNASGVVSTTQGRTVILTGVVSTGVARAEIEAKVQAIPGVNRIINKIEVSAAANVAVPAVPIQTAPTEVPVQTFPEPSAAPVKPARPLNKTALPVQTAPAPVVP